jgi:hypothetical protein
MLTMYREYMPQSRMPVTRTCCEAVELLPLMLLRAAVAATVVLAWCVGVLVASISWWRCAAVGVLAGSG